MNHIDLLLHPDVKESLETTSCKGIRGSFTAAASAATLPNSSLSSSWHDAPAVAERTLPSAHTSLCFRTSTS